jgi:formylglycine-generating enzyme required for sulfatase activity
MADIFISYARADQDKVRPIAKAMEAKGWSVWWDARIRSGEAFDRVIEKALAEARCVVAVWSANSVESDWVREEASDGLERGILISIAIERDLNLPLRFRNIHTEPLIDWDGKKPSRSFDKIIFDIAAILSRPETIEKPTATKKRHPDLDAMVEVPAGEFIYQDSSATIKKPYMIDVYPVTNQHYEKFITAEGYKDNDYWSKQGQAWLRNREYTEPRYWTDDSFNQPDHPVVGVSYYEAEAYAKWAGKRLPADYEWERAARGIDGRAYPWGDEFDQKRCNTAGSTLKKTTPVSRYPNGVSPVGCYDMAGNVCEWTVHPLEDDGKIPIRLTRGGSWHSIRKYARCDFRNIGNRQGGNYIGFRCVKDI